MINDYAIVLTHNRPDLLPGCVDAIADQVDLVVVVDNASSPPATPTWRAENYEFVFVPDQPPNLAKMWNAQLDRIASKHEDGDTWNVAVLCDDVTVPNGWFRCVADQMREHDAAAASTHSYEAIYSPYRLTALTNGGDRMCPWAFVLPGERGLRADESMRWWYCDTDLDWQARQSGGTVVVPGPVAVNGRIGDFTARIPELSAQTHRDAQTFHAKWGV